MPFLPTMEECGVPPDLAHTNFSDLSKMSTIAFMCSNRRCRVAYFRGNFQAKKRGNNLLLLLIVMKIFPGV